VADDLILRLEALLDALGTVLATAAPPLLLPVVNGPVLRPKAARRLPVLETLGQAVAQAPEVSRPFLAGLLDVAPELVWRQTYQKGVVDDAFLRGYGWTELVGAGGLVRDPSVSTGLLLLAPGVHYPPHQHPAVEHYLPLSGLADWFDEDRGWRPAAPLTTIVHRSEIIHAMRTGREPLLAYFQWSGPGLQTSARLSDPLG
jgi:hypothetical protein